MAKNTPELSKLASQRADAAEAVRVLFATADKIRREADAAKWLAKLLANTLKDVRDNVQSDTPETWERVENALAQYKHWEARRAI